MSKPNQEVRPRNGAVLMVIVVARISGGPRQKELSLKDQEDHAREVIAELYTGPTEFKIIATKGKGERLDRPELAELESLLRSRKYDFLIPEDLGRIVRGPEAGWLCGIAVDCGVRVISPNDCIDTNDESWEEDVISACRDHVSNNIHTSKRLKKKLMLRFLRNGGAAAREIFGYVVGADVTNYNDWKRDEDATAIFVEWFERLLVNRNYSAIADWLNEKGVPTGPYARKKYWDGKMVARVTKNAILKGCPGRGFKKTVKHHESGRRVSLPNPDGPNYLFFEHLVHVPEWLWDKVNAVMHSCNKNLGRKPVDGRDPRAGVSKTSTVFPGQHVVCGTCGRQMYWGGHGQNDHMMCSGSHKYECWNGSTFDGVVAGPKLLAAYLKIVETLPGFDDAFLEEIRQVASETHGHRGDKLKVVDQKLATCEREIENLVGAIRQMGYSARMDQDYKAATALQMQLLADRARIAEESDELPVLPPLEELKRMAREVGDLGLHEREFCTTMRLLMPKITVYPYQLLDGGQVVLRAVAEVNLAPLIPDGQRWIGDRLRGHFCLDLFEPPQRAVYMRRIAEKRSAGWTERRIAAEYNLTITAVQRAMVLYRMMTAAGLDDPYVHLTQPPADGGKLQRHLHPRYHFRPLEGYPSEPPIE